MTIKGMERCDNYPGNCLTVFIIIYSHWSFIDVMQHNVEKPQYMHLNL